ncbi:MAG TPA: hypothetical protein VGS79_26155 [Puia sp.]|nr:hypothetical protein [Puia sp.]
MKILFVMMVLLFVYQFVKAQTWSEWFHQNQTQLKYLQEQIAALQLFNNTQAAGYFVSETGLTEIDSTEEADFTEHNLFFERLAIPNEVLLHDPRILEISHLCERCGLIAGAISSLDMLPAENPMDWLTLCSRTSEEIEDSSNEIAGRLHNVAVPQQLQMSDAEKEQEIYDLLESARKLYKKAANQYQLMSTQPNLR